MRERISSQLENDITTTIQLLSLSYSSAELVDVNGSQVPGSDLCFAYLKLYKQTPHAEPGTPKPEDKSRFVEMSVMPPGEWYDFVDEGMGTPQNRATEELWVYDEEWKPTGSRLEDYLMHFYKDLFPSGYSFGLSPMGLFQVVGESDSLTRCFQLDLERGEKDVDKIVEELQTRAKNPDAVRGFVVKSSEAGMHFHGNLYYGNDSHGQVNLACLYGCALLLNREGLPKMVDERSVGHQLRSFSDDWRSDIRDSETGCLRIVRSLLKNQQPQFVTFAPYDI